MSEQLRRVLLGILATTVILGSSLSAIAQSGSPDLIGYWRGLLECQGGKSSSAFLSVQTRGFGEGGLTGRLSLDSTGASLSAWSRDGSSFQPERNSINYGASAFRLVRLSPDEVEIHIQGGYCTARGALQRERKDKVEDIYMFSAGGPQEWQGRSPTDKIGGGTFFQALSKLAPAPADPALSRELAQLQSKCTFNSVQTTPFGLTATLLAASTTLRYGVVGASGSCQDGTVAAVFATSELLWLGKELKFGAPRLCISNSNQSSFKSCWLYKGKFICVDAPKPNANFSCGTALPLVHSEVDFALRRGGPEECETTTYQACDRTVDGSLINCRASSLRRCTGGPDATRNQPPERVSAKFGSWSGPTGEPAVVTMPGAAAGAGACPSTFEARRGRGEALQCFCPPSRARMSMWGGEGGVYSDNSNICMAARHTGAITDQGSVIVRPASGRSSYPAWVRNGYTSFSGPRSDFAFTVSTASSPALSPQERPPAALDTPPLAESPKPTAPAVTPTIPGPSVQTPPAPATPADVRNRLLGRWNGEAAMEDRGDLRAAIRAEVVPQGAGLQITIELPTLRCATVLKSVGAFGLTYGFERVSRLGDQETCPDINTAALILMSDDAVQLIYSDADDTEGLRAILKR
jgi:hypothetical protein